MKEVTLGSSGKSVDKWIKASELKSGDKFVGTYLDSWTGGEYNTTTHKIEQEDGKVLGINGTGQLNKLMEKVQKGSAVEVHYAGKVKLDKGPMKGKHAHQFSVLADKVIEPGEDAPF